MLIGGIVVGALITLCFIGLAVHLICRAFVLQAIEATVVDSSPFNLQTKVFTVQIDLPDGKKHLYRFIGYKHRYVVGQPIQCFYDPRKPLKIQTDLHVGGRYADFWGGMAYVILAIASFYFVMRWFVFSDPTVGDGILVADSLKSLLK